MQQNEDDLLRAMYEEYQDVLWRVARRCQVPYDDIEDVLQETFVAYFRNYPLDWRPSQKKAMLMRILKNKCADYFRRNRNYDNVSIDSEEFDELEILSDHIVRNSLDYILVDETCRELRDEIYSMKKDWRDVAVLGLIEGRPIPEICEILELNYDVCKMRLFRIRKYLREKNNPGKKSSAVHRTRSDL